MNDIVNWLNNNLSSNQDFNQNDIPNVLAFSLLWNMFESLCCGKDANMGKIKNLVDKHVDIFDEQNYSDVFDYFYNRYKENSKLNALNLTATYKELAYNILNDTYTDKNNKLKFILAIIYRYRNNLFHGEKKLIKLKYQEENFKRSNQFLMYFIETYQREDL